MHKPISEKPLYNHDGIHKLYRFNNNYGASVIRGKGSYGYEKGQWELAVIYYKDDSNYDINYDTSIANDVIGYLSEEKVEDYLNQIEALPSKQSK